MTATDRALALCCCPTDASHVHHDVHRRMIHARAANCSSPQLLAKHRNSVTGHIRTSRSTWFARTCLPAWHAIVAARDFLFVEQQVITRQINRPACDAGPSAARLSSHDSPQDTPHTRLNADIRRAAHHPGAALPPRPQQWPGGRAPGSPSGRPA